MRHDRLQVRRYPFSRKCPILRRHARRRARCHAQLREPAFEELCSWVDFFNGHVHPKLDIATTSLGCRGVITKAVLTSEDQATLPCIAIPDSLAISPPVATQQLQTILTQMGLDNVQDLSPEVIVALFLAFEKSKGSDSRWHPYIMTMPTVPSCGFMLTDDEAREQLGRYFADVEVDQRLQQLRASEQAYQQEILESEDFMDALNLDVPDVRWALGQALSRAYGSEPILVPVVDCVNHSSKTVPPLMIKNDEGQLLTAISNFDSDFEIRELSEGDEVFVNYAGEQGFECSRMEMFIDYGFVPEEMLETAHGASQDDEDFDM